MASESCCSASVPAAGTRSRWASAMRLIVAVAATGAAAVAVWLRLSGSRKRGKKSHLPGPSLADELREALQFEADDDDEVAADFQSATTWVSTSDAGGDLQNEDKLALYGCYKQATAGDCPTTKRPWGIEAGMKWEAWDSQRGAPAPLAMRRYVALLDQVADGWRDGDEVRIRGGAAQQMSTGPTVSLMGKMVGDGDEVADETPIGQLCERIAEGELDAVRDILRKSPGLAGKSDKDQMTPLHWAADRGEMAITELILTTSAEARSGISAKDGNGDTALHYAVLADNPEVAKLLIKHGANPQVANNDGETPENLAEGVEWEEMFRSSST